MVDTRATTLRTCAKCSAPGAVRVVRVTKHYNRGVPSGTTYDHRCQQCNAAFETLSVYKTLLDGFFAALLIFGGVGLLVRNVPTIIQTVVYSPSGVIALRGLDSGVWWGIGIGALIGLLGTLWASWIGWQSLALVRNPPA